MSLASLLHDKNNVVSYILLLYVEHVPVIFFHEADPLNQEWENSNSATDEPFSLEVQYSLYGSDIH